jgi:hypothetical protein
MSGYLKQGDSAPVDVDHGWIHHPVRHLDYHSIHGVLTVSPSSCHADQVCVEKNSKMVGYVDHRSPQVSGQVLYVPGTADKEAVQQE